MTLSEDEAALRIQKYCFLHFLRYKQYKKENKTILRRRELRVEVAEDTRWQPGRRGNKHLTGTFVVRCNTIHK